MTKFIKCLSTTLKLRNPSLIALKVNFQSQRCSKCSNVNCKNPKCPNRQSLSLEERSTAQAWKVQVTPTYQTRLYNLYSIPKLKRYIEKKNFSKYCYESCRDYKDDDLSSIQSLAWLKRNSKIPYRSEVEQAAIDLYRKSIKAYTALQKIVRNSLENPRIRTLEPARHIVGRTLDLTAANLLSIKKSIRSLSCKSQCLYNGIQAYNRNNLNNKYCTNCMSGGSEVTKRNTGTSHLYSTSSGGDTCSKCKKPSHECSCKNDSDAQDKKPDCDKCEKPKTSSCGGGCTCGSECKCGCNANKDEKDKSNVKSSSVALCCGGPKGVSENPPVTCKEDKTEKCKDTKYFQPKKCDNDEDLLCKYQHILRDVSKQEREAIDSYFKDCYKNKEGFLYHKGSYYDMVVHTQKDRCPQPDSKKKSARKISVCKK